MVVNRFGMFGLEVNWIGIEGPGKIASHELGCELVSQANPSSKQHHQIH
jgi:hypothetical protein